MRGSRAWLLAANSGKRKFPLSAPLRKTQGTLRRRCAPKLRLKEAPMGPQSSARRKPASATSSLALASTEPDLGGRSRLDRPGRWEPHRSRRRKEDGEAGSSTTSPTSAEHVSARDLRSMGTSPQDRKSNKLGGVTLRPRTFGSLTRHLTQSLTQRSTFVLRVLTSVVQRRRKRSNHG